MSDIILVRLKLYKYDYGLFDFNFLNQNDETKLFIPEKMFFIFLSANPVSSSAVEHVITNDNANVNGDNYIVTGDSAIITG